MTRKSNSDVKFLQKENESLKKDIESLKNEFGRITSVLKSHESLCSSHKPHPEMEKSLEIVGAEYEELNSHHVALKKELKALDEQLLSARVNEMAIEIDNLVQHTYSFNIKLVSAPEIAEAGLKQPNIDMSKLCVRIF